MLYVRRHIMLYVTVWWQEITAKPQRITTKHTNGGVIWARNGQQWASGGPGMRASACWSSNTLPLDRSVIVALQINNKEKTLDYNTGITMWLAVLNGDHKALEAIFAANTQAKLVFDSYLDAALVTHVCKDGSVDFLRWLIDRGADPNAIKGIQEIQDLYGHGFRVSPVTPLFRAVESNRQDLVEALLKLGARPALAIANPSRSYGKFVSTLTPKLLAYQKGLDNLVAILVASGATEPVPAALHLLRNIIAGNYSKAFELYFSQSETIDPYEVWYYISPLDAAVSGLTEATWTYKVSSTRNEALDALVYLILAFLEHAEPLSEKVNEDIATAAVLLGDPSLLRFVLRGKPLPRFWGTRLYHEFS